MKQAEETAGDWQSNARAATGAGLAPDPATPAGDPLDDTDEQLRLERLKRQQGERCFHALLEAMLDAVIIVGTNGCIALANSHAERLFGYSRQELREMPVERLVPERFRERHAAERRAYLAYPRERPMGTGLDLWALRKDGSEFPAEISLSPLETGEASTVLAAIRDITERKRMEQALRESARRFRAIFDQTYEFIGLLAPDGTLLEINQTALDFAGVTLREVVGRPFWETPWATAQAREPLKAAIAQAAQGTFLRYEAKHPGPDGEVHTIDFSLKPVTDESGGVVLIIPEGRDITERKRAEAIARRARQQLEQVNAQLKQSLQKLQEDEAAGRSMQFQLLPEKQKTYGSFEFSCHLLTSTYLSGDFVDYFVIDNEHLGFYMADVSGHGVPSALVTVLLKSYMNRYLETYHQNGDAAILDPAATLARLNQDIVRGHLGKYLTMFYGVLSRHESVLSYANGGQFPFPILFDGEQARFIPCKSLPIGLFDFAEYHTDSIPLSPRFALVLVSDGVLETLPQPTVREKETALLAAVNSTEVSVAALVQGLGLDKAGPPPDDITFLLIRRLA